MEEKLLGQLIEEDILKYIPVELKELHQCRVCGASATYKLEDDYMFGLDEEVPYLFLCSECHDAVSGGE